MNVQKYLSTCNIDQILEETSSANHSAAILGLDLVRLPINLNFHADWDARTASYDIKTSCKQWLQKLGFPWLMPELTNMAMPKLPTNYTHQPSPLLQSCTDFIYGVSHCKDIVITCEDKDNNVCWAQLGPHMVCRWHHMLTSSSRWAFTNMTTYEVVRLYREEFDNCLPKFLLTGNTKIARRNIPTMYETIKYKCFRQAQRVLELYGAWFPATPTKLAIKTNTVVSETWFLLETFQAGSNFVRSRVA